MIPSGLLIGSTSILQAKWHDIICVCSLMCGECCLGFVLLNHFDLIVAGEAVHEGEEPISSGIIDQGIDVWQRKIILGTSLVQIPIINTYAYFFIFLRHGNNVGNPIRVGYCGKGTSFQLLFYFFFDLQNDLRF